MLRIIRIYSCILIKHHQDKTLKCQTHTHTPGNGEDEVEGDGTLVFRRVELVVVSHLREKLQCDQRGNLNREIRQKSETTQKNDRHGQSLNQIMCARCNNSSLMLTIYVCS